MWTVENRESMEESAYLLKSVANATRLSIIQILRTKSELNVSEMVKVLDLEQSLLSHHLTDMRAKGVLHCRKSGQKCYYSIKNKQIAHILDCIEKCKKNH